MTGAGLDRMAAVAAIALMVPLLAIGAGERQASRQRQICGRAECQLHRQNAQAKRADETVAEQKVDPIGRP